MSTDIMENIMEVPQKTGNRTHIPSISLLGIHPKEIKSICQKDIGIPKFYCSPIYKIQDLEVI